ncbi:MAG: DUF4251 domain-containing protein [Rikenellaceae bacterium]
MKITTSLLIAGFALVACGSIEPLFAWPDNPNASTEARVNPTTASSVTASSVDDASAVAQVPSATRSATSYDVAVNQTPTVITTPVSTATTATITPTTNTAMNAAVEGLSEAVSVANAEAGDVQHSRVRDNAERRQIKNLEFVAKLDTLVRSHNYQFVPTSMQEIPNGDMQFIYNFYYYVAVVDSHVEVHIPTVRGGYSQYINILNFDTFGVTNYRTSQTHFGWAISFNVTSSNGNSYAFAINLYTATGEAVMSLMSDSNVIKYIGRLEKI